MKKGYIMKLLTNISFGILFFMCSGMLLTCFLFSINSVFSILLIFFIPTIIIFINYLNMNTEIEQAKKTNNENSKIKKELRKRKSQLKKYNHKVDREKNKFEQFQKGIIKSKNELSVIKDLKESFEERAEKFNAKELEINKKMIELKKYQITQDKLDEKEQLLKHIEDQISQKEAILGNLELLMPILTSFIIDNELKIIDIMNGIDFENYLSDIFTDNGYQNEVTKASNDQGADLLASKNGITFAIQAKRYGSPMGNTPVQEVHAAKYFYKKDKAIVVTNSTFTTSAEALALECDVKLIDREGLKQLIKNSFDQNPKSYIEKYT